MGLFGQTSAGQSNSGHVRRVEKQVLLRSKGSWDDKEQVYNIGKITNAKVSGMLGLRKVSFVASEDGMSHTLERVQKDNAKLIGMYVEKSG